MSTRSLAVERVVSASGDDEAVAGERGGEQVEQGEQSHEGIEKRVEAEEFFVSGEVAAGDDGALGNRGSRGAGLAGVGVVEGDVEQFGKEAVVRAPCLNREPRRQQGFEFAPCVSGADVAMPRVGEAERQSEAAERGMFLDVGDVGDESAGGAEGAVDFANERFVVGEVFEHVDDDDEVEDVVGERQGFAVGLKDVVADEITNGGDGGRIEVGAGPSAALAAEEKADDAVVGAEVESAAIVPGFDEGVDLSPFGLFQDGATEQSQRQVFAGVGHGLCKP